MKAAVIGAGNVGGQIAMLLIKEGTANILLLDVAGSLAKGKALDLQDFAALAHIDCNIEGSDDFSLLKDSNIVVLTAGLARRPGMSREDLLKLNAKIVKDVSLKIKEYARESIVIVVTNPVDLMTYLAFKTTGFNKNKVFGMGVSLDAARYANLIHRELNVPVSRIEPLVIGVHGQGMLPLPRLSKVGQASLEKLLDEEALANLNKAAVDRGASIVSCLGSGSAYFGPAMAVTNIIKVILNDQKQIFGICAYLDGQYGIKDLYLGVPARLGKNGVEEIVELELNSQEKESLLESAESVRSQIKQLG